MGSELRPAKDVRVGDRVTLRDGNGDQRGTVVGDVSEWQGYMVLDVDIDGRGRRTFRIHRESRIGQ